MGQLGFDPFGNILARGGIGQTILGYTGQQTDETGLVYLRARYYDPRVGRFLTEDSLIPNPTSSQGWNRYVYVNNNPIRYIDPSGHQCFEMPLDSAIPFDPVGCLGGGGGPAGRGGSGISSGGMIKAGIIGVGAGGTGVVIANEVLETYPAEAPDYGTLPGTTSEIQEKEIIPCSEPVEMPPLPPFTWLDDPLGDIFSGTPLDSGVPPLIVLASTHKHHIFPQQYRSWFARRGINIDDYTVAIDSTTHLRGVHGRGLGDLPGRWNQRWDEFISANPDADTTEITQFANQLMREYGLDNLPVEPY